MKTITYNPAPGDKLVFGCKVGKAYTIAEPEDTPAPPTPPAAGFVLQCVVDDSRYHTQGFGAKRYAQGAAEAQADLYRGAGFEVKVREVRGTPFQLPV